MKDLLAGLVRLAGDEAAAQARRIAGMVALILVATVLLLVAAGFGVGAAYTAIANALDPVAAGAIVAAFFMVVGLIVLMIGLRMGRRPKVPDRLPEIAPVQPVSTASVAASFAYGLARGFLRRRR